MDSYVVIDIETTGLCPASDRITELAALRVRNGVVVSSFQELVNPHVPIPGIVAEKTHITNEMVACAKDVPDVLRRFLDFVGDDVWIGYNLDRFDVPFIASRARCTLGLIVQPQTIDVFDLVKCSLNLRSYSLDAVRREFGIDSSGAHRALKDCQDTNDVYCRVSTMGNVVKRAPKYSVRVFGSHERDEVRYMARCEELLSKIPDGFSPVYKTHVPKHYKERWSYVREHPFSTFASAIVVITGSCDLVPRLAAEEIVKRLGATLKPSTTRDCDFCINLGNGGCCKMEGVRKWKEKGSPIEVIDSNRFLEMFDASLAEKSLSSDVMQHMEAEVSEIRKAKAAGQTLPMVRTKSGLIRRVDSATLHEWRQSFAELWNSVLADDRIDMCELMQLRDWLLNHKRKRANYKEMLGAIGRVIEKGVVDYDDSIQLYHAAELCLLEMGGKPDSN